MKLHHVGFVVNDVEQSAQYYRSMGYENVTDVVTDPIQKMRAVFLGLGNGVQLELLEPTTEDSPLANFLEKRGGGLHHLCHEVKDLEKTMRHFAEHGALEVCQPVPAVAFGGRRIAFMYTPQKELLEFLEA